MQTELHPKLEQALVAEAAERGLSVEENTRRVLEEHAKELLHGTLPMDVEMEINTPDEGYDWILSRNPNLRRVPSGEIDWRRLMHEGHRY